MKILLIDPHQEIIEKYKNDSKVLIFETNQFIANINNFENIDLAKKIEEHELQLLLEKLRALGPLWTRWANQNFENEMVLREGVIFNLSIRKFLKAHKIKYAVFHTSICHHVYDNIIQIALEDLNIPQVFLYGIQVCNRLLPLVQKKGIADRKPLNLTLNTYEGNNEIEIFYENLKKSKPPLLNVVHSERNKNYFFAIIFWLKFWLKTQIRKTKRNLELPFVETLGSLTLNYGLDLLIAQKKAIRFYNENISKDVEIEIAGSGKKNLLIAAHYQPEATTFPEGGVWNNYIDQVILIRSLGYTDTIYFKEHPASFSYYDSIVGLTRVACFRSIDFYQSLLSLGCKFVSPSISLKPDGIIFSNIVPVTMTGTIAIERSLMGHPTIVTGYPWYKGMPGIYPLRSISKVLNLKFDAQLSLKTKEYLIKTISKNSIPNSIGIATGNKSNEEHEMNVFLVHYENMVTALRKSR